RERIGGHERECTGDWGLAAEAKATAGPKCPPSGGPHTVRLKPDATYFSKTLRATAGPKPRAGFSRYRPDEARRVRAGLVVSGAASRPVHLCAQSAIASTADPSARPFFVSAYSTRTGVSGMTVRSRMPS